MPSETFNRSIYICVCVCVCVCVCIYVYIYIYIYIYCFSLYISNKNEIMCHCIRKCHIAKKGTASVFILIWGLNRTRFGRFHEIQQLFSNG